MNQSLSKNERLKSYKRIRILFAEGEKFRVQSLLVHYRFITPSSPVPPPSSLQTGISVSSRYFKRAVDRNLLKRRIREAYRKQKSILKTTLEDKGMALDLFFVYIEPEISSYDQIYLCMSNALKTLTQKLTPNS